MSGVERIILTAIATIIGGVIVYFFGHLSVALFVEPIHRLRSLIGEIADSLVFYTNVYCNPGFAPKDKSDEASEALRRQASQLKARAYAIPWYSLWEFIKIVRRKREIQEASAELIGLSNSVHGGPGVSAHENHRKRERVEKLLGIVRDLEPNPNQSLISDQSNRRKSTKQKGGVMENSIDEEKAYQILLQHQLDENRLIGERTSLFALATSILLIAFAMLVPLSKIVCTILAATGLVYCVAVWGALTASVRALDFWIMRQRQIEEQGGGCFAYMREQRLSPQIYGLSNWQSGPAKSWRLYPHIAWFVVAVWVVALVYLWLLS